MLRYNIKRAIRNIKKRPVTSLINIVGFSVGITCVVIISLWIHVQKSYDTFHTNYNSIYRITMQFTNKDDSKIIHIPTLFGPGLKDELAEVTEFVRFGESAESVFKYKEFSSYESAGFFADNSVFTIFDFKILQGNEKEALTSPFTIALSESFAKKYFQGEDPIGKQLKINNDAFTVTTIFKDVPFNSHLQFEYLMSEPTLDIYWNSPYDWNSNRVYTYLKINTPTNIPLLQEKINQIVSSHTSIWDDMKIKTYIQPLSEVYLDYEQTGEGKLKTGDSRDLYIFLIAGIAIMLISCINYVNLFNAQNLFRNKEIGVNILLGAGRKNLTTQFGTETLLHIAIAFLLSILTFMLLLPYVQTNIGSQISLDPTFIKPIIVSMISIVAVCALMGIIPVLRYTRFQTSGILQKNIIYRRSRNSSLITFQFLISIVLIIGMFVITKQKNYLMNKKLGFDKEHVIYIPMQSNLTKSYDSFKEELLKNPMISSVTMKRGVPDSWYDGGNYWKRGMTFEESPNAERFWVGYDYFKTMGIKILQGRAFSSENRNDIDDACLMNEKAVEALGLDDPIGQEIFFNDQRRIIIGVVANTNSKSLKEDYYPELYLLNWNNYGSGLIILANVQGQVDASLKAMEKLWYSYNPDDPFKYEFLDETYGRLYMSEQKMSQVFKVFAGIAIILSCLGILGLAIFEVQSRIKEIGIRKVNGSTSMSILVLLCMRYVKIVVVAFVLACPIAWYAMTNWLENFAYKISLSWWIFLLGGVFALTIAMLTVFWQSWRAANLNPVKTLRYE